MTPARVLLIAGPSAAGKTTLGSMLADLLGVGLINSGDLLRAYLRAQGVSLEDELNPGQVFLDRFGERMAGEVIAGGARRAGASIVDGIRLFSSLDAFVRLGSDASVILISASLPVRRARVARTPLVRDSSTSIRPDPDEILTRKAVWDADLPELGRTARWGYVNESTLGALAGFARSVATESGIKSRSPSY